jgi:sulfatase modifying factor 1
MSRRRSGPSIALRVVVPLLAVLAGGAFAVATERARFRRPPPEDRRSFAASLRPAELTPLPPMAVALRDDHRVESAAPAAAAAPASDCPDEMELVAGRYCPRVSERCLEWARDDRRRCLRFADPTRCVGHRRSMRFCMDRYEWPNRRGELPQVMTTWNEAAAACRAAGRRLCTQDEWTFACEGEEMLPYPYGYERADGACTVDHRARAPDRVLLGSSDRAVSFAEAARVYEAAPSGSAGQCVSPFGVYDLVGSVDEWTVNTSGVPFRSALKGGWWGRIRGRCRPATLAHNEAFRYYQIGFRCCANVPRRP